MIDFLQVILTVLSLVLFAVPGFILVKVKLMPNGGMETLSNVVLYVCQPAMLFMAFQEYEYNDSLALNFLYVFLIALLVHAIMIVLILIFCKNPDSKKRVFSYASIFGNCGFMGIPFIKMLFGGSDALGEMLIYLAIIQIVWNVLNWTVGVFLVTRDKKEMSVKKIVFNPAIIGVILGFLCFVLLKKPIVNLAKDGSSLDSILEKLAYCFNLIGDAVTPVSMMVIGVRLASINFKSLLADKFAYLSSLNKLVVMPFIAMLIVAFLPIDVTVKYAIFFTSAMPSATTSALFAVKFGADSELGAKCVLLSTVLSIAVIPLMYLVFSGVFGVTI